MTSRDDVPAGRSVRAVLAALALLLGAGAWVAGEGTGADAGVEPRALAARIRDREAGLLVLDVRGDGFDPALTVPTATAASPDAPERWPLHAAAAVVVYGLDDAASRAARDSARALGRSDARHLRGGLAGWVSDVLEPVLPVPVTRADSAANAEIAQLSRYFGGLPRIAVPGHETTGDAAATVRRAARRGCGPGF